MEGGLALLGGGGGGGGEDSTNESVVSSPAEVEAELELGLGLSIGGGGRLFGGGSVSGTKRAADSVSNASQQVVGWPPIRAYRINSLVNQAKASRSEEDKSVVVDKDYKSKDVLKKKICSGNKNEKLGFVGFVKVNMDGVPIGRKIDLNAHNSYDTLSQSLEDMFFHSITPLAGEKQQPMKPSKLLEDSSEFVLTYEDKDGDWMLVGDVPWGMFVTSVKRLRIMRTSESNGLAPRFQEMNTTQRSKRV